MSAPRPLRSLYGYDERDQSVFTPVEILDAIRHVWPEGIAMDPCGHPDAPIQADDPVYGRTGGQIDGLEIPWPQRTYANPPFNELKAWLKKAAMEACRMQASGYAPDVMLLAPVRTHRVWFWDLGMVSSMAWLKPVKFHGHKQAFPAPLVMLYWGLRYSEFRDAFSELSTKVDR